MMGQEYDVLKHFNPFQNTEYFISPAVQPISAQGYLLDNCFTCGAGDG